MNVRFEVAGDVYRMPEEHAIILAENLRILARSEFAPGPPPRPLGSLSGDWRPTACDLADSIEETVVTGVGTPLHLEGSAADAAYCVLRLMVDVEGNGSGGLRNALGAPVGVIGERPRRERSRGLDPSRHLTRPELVEFLAVLFGLAVITIVAGVAWTGTWYILAPVIAVLLGLRVATTTRVSGRFAWSFASLLWWTVMLVPAAVLVALVSLLVVAVIS